MVITNVVVVAAGEPIIGFELAIHHLGNIRLEAHVVIAEMVDACHIMTNLVLS